jgi:hypothetical protein
MKTTDFRIGNLMRDKYSKDIIKVNGITENDIFFSGNFTKEWQAEPISLTEEWLLKFGFKVDYGCILLSTKRGTITIEEDLAEISSVITHNGFMAPCEYVHELQNLYYALTKEELILCELN